MVPVDRWHVDRYILGRECTGRHANRATHSNAAAHGYATATSSPSSFPRWDRAFCRTGYELWHRRQSACRQPSGAGNTQRGRQLVSTDQRHMDRGVLGGERAGGHAGRSPRADRHASASTACHLSADLAAAAMQSISPWALRRTIAPGHPSAGLAACSVWTRVSLTLCCAAASDRSTSGLAAGTVWPRLSHTLRRAATQARLLEGG